MDDLKETLEFENLDLTENTILKEIENYDSLSILTIIALVDEKFEKKLTAKQLASISTVRSLMELIGLEYFTE